ncbi:HypC/HybG/HupF family hydrogenase formation chaperone [Hydrogenophaga sp.]|uniref:HypC/HybG/HupF family hydrogenase formation chaperone n=1 Tax=Hydrogenophaga sp. TaxID=1904254 RepID=UPI0035615C30
MCIGIPMQVLSIEPGHAVCSGRGLERRVRTALVDPVAPGEWLLIFLDSAQEHIDATRAQEINGTLDLLEMALDNPGLTNAAPTTAAAFELPSRMSREQLLALSTSTP